MTPRRDGRIRRRGEVVLFFGEDSNDGRAVAELFKALCPNYVGRCKALRSPLILARNARPDAAAGKAQDLCLEIEQNQILDNVRCCFLVQDCDATEPEDRVRQAELEQLIATAGCSVHVVVIAWEIEAWWFLWPDTASRVVRSWRKPDRYVGREVGLITNAKEAYRQAVRPVAGRPNYEEAHSPRLAEQVRLSGAIRAPQGRSGSFERFVTKADECCAA